MSYDRQTHAHDQYPTAVAAVLEMGYPQEQVLSTYRELQSHMRQADVTSGAAVTAHITSELLLEAVEGRPTPLGRPAREFQPLGTGLVQSSYYPDDIQEDNDNGRQVPQPLLTNAVPACKYSSSSPPAAAAAAEASCIPSTIGQAGHDDASKDGISSASEVAPIPDKTASATQPGKATPGGHKGKKRSPRSKESRAKTLSENKENSVSPVSSQNVASTSAQEVEEASALSDQIQEQTLTELKSRVRVLEKENRKLKERQTCRHCRVRPVSLTLLPCGHFCYCQECGSTFHSCPICRKTILADVRTIVS